MKKMKISLEQFQLKTSTTVIEDARAKTLKGGNAGGAHDEGDDSSWNLGTQLQNYVVPSPPSSRRGRGRHGRRRG